jgi:hypothetical protein
MWDHSASEIKQGRKPTLRCTWSVEWNIFLRVWQLEPWMHYVFALVWWTTFLLWTNVGVIWIDRKKTCHVCSGSMAKYHFRGKITDWKFTLKKSSKKDDECRGIEFNLDLKVSKVPKNDPRLHGFIKPSSLNSKRENA